MNIKAKIIQPIWLIEEKAINFRKEPWFKPPIAPTKADKIIKINILLFKFKYDKIIMGANFCQVIKVKQLIQFIFSITLGNQKWKGDAPSFNIKVIIIIELDKILLLRFNKKKSIFIIIIYIIMEKKMIVDARAWTKK